MASRVGGRARVWASGRGNVGILLSNGETPTNGDQRTVANRYEYFTPDEAFKLALRILLTVEKARKGKGA